MNVYSTLLYISLFGLCCDILDTKRRKHSRHGSRQDEIYFPAFVDFELKGRSLAWFPVKLNSSYMGTIVEKPKRQKHRKCRYIEEPSCNRTGKPKKIYNVQEDEDDPDAGRGENDEEPVDDYDDDNAEDDSPTLNKSLVQTSYITADTDKVTPIPDHIINERYTLYSSGGPLTGNTQEDITVIVPDILVSITSEFTGNYPSENPTTSLMADFLDVHLTADLNRTQSTIQPTIESPKGNDTIKDSSTEFNSESSNNGLPKLEPSVEHITTSSTVGFTTERSITDMVTGSSAIYIPQKSTKKETATESFTTSPITKLSTGIHSSVKMNFTPGINRFQPITGKPDFQSTSEGQHVLPSTTAVSAQPNIDYHHTIPPFNISSPSYLYTIYSTTNVLQTLPNQKNSTIQKTWHPIDVDTSDPVSEADKEDEEVGDYLEDNKNEEKTGNNWGVMCMHSTKQSLKTFKLTSLATRLPHIETPPYPKRPLDLNFPTCSGNDDSLDIKLPSFETRNEKKKEKCKHRKRKRTTSVKSFKKQTVTTLANIVKNYIGNKSKDTKVLVRIPPSLADLPVVVLKDPQTPKLSLSLINEEQEVVKQKPLYYLPHLYQPFFPSFPYHVYLPNYIPLGKMYPYGYIGGPNVVSNKPNYLIPRRNGYINNLRWVRDTYYFDEEERNSTKSQ